LMRSVLEQSSKICIDFFSVSPSAFFRESIVIKYKRRLIIYID